jgi:hypothetical protein
MLMQQFSAFKRKPRIIIILLCRRSTRWIATRYAHCCHEICALLPRDMCTVATRYVHCLFPINSSFADEVSLSVLRFRRNLRFGNLFHRCFCLLGNRKLRLHRRFGYSRTAIFETALAVKPGGFIHENLVTTSLTLPSGIDMSKDVASPAQLLHQGRYF